MLLHLVGTTATVVTVIVYALDVILGIFGLSITYKKTYQLARGLSILWWAFTVMSALSEVIDIIVTDNEEIRRFCRGELEKIGRARNQDLFNICYFTATAVAIVCLVAHILLMTCYGITICRYTELLNDRSASGAFEHSTSVQLTDAGKSTETMKLK